MFFVTTGKISVRDMSYVMWDITFHFSIFGPKRVDLLWLVIDKRWQQIIINNQYNKGHDTAAVVAVVKKFLKPHNINVVALWPTSSSIPGKWKARSPPWPEFGHPLIRTEPASILSYEQTLAAAAAAAVGGWSIYHIPCRNHWHLCCCYCCYWLLFQISFQFW